MQITKQKYEIVWGIKRRERVSKNLVSEISKGDKQKLKKYGEEYRKIWYESMSEERETKNKCSWHLRSYLKLNVNFFLIKMHVLLLNWHFETFVFCVLSAQVPECPSAWVP